MQLLCLSISHKRAPVDLRERVAVSHHQQSALRDGLLQQDGVREALVLSTCNRTEIYAVVAGDADPDPAAHLANHRGMDIEELRPFAVLHRGAAAVEHVFGLVAGLESMVVGETEVLGQVKQAYADAIAADACGKVLNALFQKAFSIAKQIRSGTDIGRFRVSVASVAVDEALRRIPDLATKRIGVWGTGPVGRAVIGNLVKQGVRGGTVVSRDLHRAQHLTQLWDGEALLSRDVGALLPEADVFFSCTGAPHPVVTPELIGADRRDRPLLVLDLAVPRDTAPEAATLPGVTVLDMDGLGEVIQSNIADRERAGEAIRPLLAEEAGQLWRCLNARQSERCVADWHQAAEAILAEEIERLAQEHPELAPDMREHIHELGHRLLARMLDWPRKAIACAVREGLPCGDIFPEIERIHHAGPLPHPRTGEPVEAERDTRDSA
jgi:glutamyl-tRNA reductase